MSDEQRTFTVPAVNMGRLRAKLDDLNKRARKLGCVEAELRVLREYETTVRNELGIEVYPYRRKWYEVEILNAEPVRLSGWRFIATIEPTEAGNIIRAAGDVEVPQRYRTSDMTCDHCHSNRYRKEVFVIQHEDGRYAQVGRNCLADFVGSTSAEHLVAQSQWLDELRGLGEEAEEGFGGGGGGFERGEETFGYVAICAAAIRMYGWLSRTEARYGVGRQATADQAWVWVVGPMGYNKDAFADMERDGFSVGQADVELATKAVEWARAIPADVQNDYLYNLRTASSLDEVTGRNSGIVASLVQAYLREVERIEVERRKREAEEANPSEWVGEVGKRDVFTLNVVGCIELQGDYGITYMIRFTDDDNNVVVWRSSNNFNWAHDTGHTVVLKATVKQHGEYKGQKQTYITRAAVIEW
jgi:hypothetical protein